MNPSMQPKKKLEPQPLTDKPNGSVNVAALYALIGQLTVQNQALKQQLEQFIAAAQTASEAESSAMLAKKAEKPSKAKEAN